MRTLQLLLFCIALLSCQNREQVAAINYPALGYDYLPADSIKDSSFFALPIKDKISRRDSFLIFYHNPILYKGFDEKNISIRPLDKSVFRLAYFDGALSSMKPVLINLTKDLITIKEGVKGSFDAWHDTAKLDTLERFHYRLLEFRYPLSDTSFSVRRRRYYDSLLNLYPKLDDPQYFKYLLDKSAVYSEVPFTYKTRYLRITQRDFQRIVTLINNSEFWSCPYDCICKNIPNDAAGFLLEANTPKKYNVITRPICPDDSSKLISAVDELIKLAGLNDKITFRWAEESLVPPAPIELKDIELEPIKPDN